jgi:HlyD family secretion protein
LRRIAAALATLLLGCGGSAEPVEYRAVKVERRDITISAEAAGVIEPEVTVEVKSKASGEILETPVEIGQQVARGTLLVRVDQRQPRNALAQAQAELEVAGASLKIAQSQRARAERLFKSQSIPETGYETAVLQEANAKAAVVRGRVAVENAQIELDDTLVSAPIDGTVIEKSVERGQVISSPTRDVGGGTILMRMADLRRVRVRTFVDETDIGKISPGVTARVSVAAHPDRTFQGNVLKIEPKALAEQNVTRFAVLIELDNPESLLKPGMNADVEMRVSQLRDVLAVPTAALVSPREAAQIATAIGIDPETVREVLRSARRDGRRGGERSRSEDSSVSAAQGVVATSAPDASGKPSAPQDEARSGGRFVSFVMRDGVTQPIAVLAGASDLDFSEIRSGLEEGESVLMVPSAGLLDAQQQQRERMNRMMGGMPGTGRPPGGGGGGGGRPGR